MHNYSLVWKQYSKNSELGRHLSADEDFGLPYFIDGNDKRNFELSKLGRLSQIHLLRGILLGYNDTPPQINMAASRLAFIKVLEDLKVYFKFTSLEKLFVDIASFIRKENGNSASLIALSTGMELLPESSVIKFDYCQDLFNLLEREEYLDLNNGKFLLDKYLNLIDKHSINSGFIPLLDRMKYWLKINQ